MNGMGAFCICCKTKVSTGIRTGDDLLEAYPMGCHACSTATGTKAEITRATLKETIAAKGHAFVDMEGKPLRPTTVFRGPPEEKKK